jgi:hypothetical protein
VIRRGTQECHRQTARSDGNLRARLPQSIAALLKGYDETRPEPEPPPPISLTDANLTLDNRSRAAASV